VLELESCVCLNRVSLIFFERYATLSLFEIEDFTNGASIERESVNEIQRVSFHGESFLPPSFELRKRRENKKTSISNDSLCNSVFIHPHFGLVHQIQSKSVFLVNTVFVYRHSIVSQILWLIQYQFICFL
jgi:hypothetical protein